MHPYQPQRPYRFDKFITFLLGLAGLLAGLLLIQSQQTAVAAVGGVTPICNYDGVLPAGNSVNPTCPIFGSNTPVNFRVAISGEDVDLAVTNHGGSVLWDATVENGETIWGTATLTVGTNNRFTFTNNGANPASINLLVYPIDSTPYTWDGQASPTGVNSQIQLQFPQSGLYQFDFGVNANGRYDFHLDTDYIQSTVVADDAETFYVAAGTYDLTVVQDDGGGMVDWSVAISYTGQTHDTLPYNKSGSDVVEEWLPINLAAATSVNLDVSVSGGSSANSVLNVELVSPTQALLGGGIDVYNNETLWDTYDLPAGVTLLHLTSSEPLDYDLTLQTIPAIPYNWEGNAADQGLNSQARVNFPTSGLYSFDFTNDGGRYQFILEVNGASFIQKTVENDGAATFYVPAGIHYVTLDQDTDAGADWGVQMSLVRAGNDTLPYEQSGGELGGVGNDFTASWLPISLDAGQHVNLNLMTYGDTDDSLQVDVFRAGNNSATPDYSWSQVLGTESSWTNFALSAGMNRIRIMANGANVGSMEYDLALTAVSTNGTASWSGSTQDTGLNPVIMVNFPSTGLYQFQIDAAEGFANLVLDDAMITALNTLGTGLDTTYDVQVTAGMHELYVVQDAAFAQTDWSASVQPIAASSSFFNFSGVLENGEMVVPEYTVPSGDLDFNFEFTVTGGDVDLTIRDGSNTVIWDGTALDGETVWGTGTLNGTNELTLTNSSGSDATVQLTLYHIPTAGYSWDGLADVAGENSHIRVDFPSNGLYTFNLGVDSGSYQLLVNSDFIQKTAVSDTSVTYFIPAGRHHLMIDQQSGSNTDWDVTISNVGAANDTLSYSKMGGLLGGGLDFSAEWLPIKLASATSVNMAVTLDGTLGDWATVQVWDNTDTLVASGNVYAQETHWMTFDLDNQINRIHLVASGGNSDPLSYELSVHALPTAGFGVAGVADMAGENSQLRAIFPADGLYTFDLGNGNGRYQLHVNSDFIQKTSELTTTVTYFVPAGTHTLMVDHDDTTGAEWSLDVSAVGAANDVLPYTKSGGDLGGDDNEFSEEWLTVETGTDMLVNLVITVTGDITDSLSLHVWNAITETVTVEPLYGSEVVWQTMTLPGNGRIHLVADGANANPLAYEIAIHPIPSTTYFLSGRSLADGLNSDVRIDLPANGRYAVTVNSYEGFTNFLPDLNVSAANSAANLGGTNTQYYEFDAAAGMVTFTSFQSDGFPVTVWDATVELLIADAPTVTAIDPVTTTVGVATAVTIEGTNFMPGITAKLVDGGNEYALTNIVRISDTEISATVPGTVPVGVYDVTVTNPDDQEATLAAAFTVEAVIVHPAEFIIFMPAIYKP